MNVIESAVAPIAGGVGQALAPRAISAMVPASQDRITAVANAEQVMATPAQPPGLGVNLFGAAVGFLAAYCVIQWASAKPRRTSKQK